MPTLTILTIKPVSERIESNTTLLSMQEQPLL
jgi:hypothetical protein